MSNGAQNHSQEPSAIEQKERLLKLVSEEENAENYRLRKLIEEGKIETVSQILSHRLAVASAKKQN